MLVGVPWRTERQPTAFPAAGEAVGETSYSAHDERRIHGVSSDVLMRLSRIIAENILGNASRRSVTAETPLLSHGLDLDSVAVLQLIMAVEVEFGVRFDEHDISIELFRTTGTLAEAVARKMPA